VRTDGRPKEVGLVEKDDCIVRHSENQNQLFLSCYIGHYLCVTERLVGSTI